MMLKIFIAIFVFIVGVIDGYELGVDDAKAKKRYTNYLYELQSKLDKTKK